MPIIESWLPFGYSIASLTTAGKALFSGKDWQIIEDQKNGKILIVNQFLVDMWFKFGFISKSDVSNVVFGNNNYYVIIGSNENQCLAPIAQVQSLRNKNEITIFALSLRASREIDPSCSFGDGIYVEKLSKILPTYSDLNHLDDDVILGLWVSGGMPVSAKSVSALHKTATWLSVESIEEIIESSGLKMENDQGIRKNKTATKKITEDQLSKNGSFTLPGRTDIEGFFNEHVIDIIKNKDRYKALGIDFPSAVVLYGPPGCGKTFAVEQLIEYLEWPSFTIEASSVASPYIHDTSKKVAEVFQKAMENLPSVLIIDEMEAFLSDRDSGSGQHHIEEVAEFLRRIPEAIKNEVLIIAMTNKIEMIDPAILRKGRFDHIIKIDFAQKEEIKAMLVHSLSKLPTLEIDIDILAEELSGRPLSDVAYLIKEGARLTAKAGKDKIDNDSLEEALDGILNQISDRDEKQNRMGFIRE